MKRENRLRGKLFMNLAKKVFDCRLFIKKELIRIEFLSGLAYIMNIATSWSEFQIRFFALFNRTFLFSRTCSGYHSTVDLVPYLSLYLLTFRLRRMLTLSILLKLLIDFFHDLTLSCKNPLQKYEFV